MSIAGYLQVLRKRWRTLVLVTLLGLLVAGLATILMPKTYEAQSTSFVSISGSDRNASPDSLYQNSQFALNQVQSYPAMVVSPEVLEPVIKRLDLHMSVRQLRSHITVTNPANTVLLQVSVTDGSPRTAQAITNAVADSLGSLLENLETPKASAQSTIKVTTAVPATLPTSPSSPRELLNIALGLLLGLAAGAVAAAVRERLDTTVKTPEDIATIAGAVPLGTIRFDRKAGATPVLVADQTSATTEDFRSIRTSLRYVDVDHGLPHQIVVSSAIPGEGKSLVAVNLALVMAQIQMNVCVVEGDLRRPRVTSYLGLDGSVGLTEVVAGERELDDVLVSWRRGQLTVLPAGTTPPDPNHLLGSRATEAVLEKLRGMFDLVVIDAPPLLPVSDAAVLGTMSDGVIMVARHGHTSAHQLQQALAKLRSVNADVIGTVLNGLPVPKGRLGYSSEYSYQQDPSLLT